MGNRGSHVRDDGRPASFLQSRPRGSFRTHSHGRNTIPEDDF